MKEHIMTTTDNVLAGMKCLKYLEERPLTEMAGLGLIYGNTGLGKTRFAMRMAIDNNHIYLRVKQNDTPKSLLLGILEKIMINYGIDDSSLLRGSTATLGIRVEEEINRQTTSDHIPVIFIDEIDYALDRRRDELMGTIRDLVDNTVVTIVMVGEEKAREKLMRLNRHYYGRCSYLCEFKPISRRDAVKIMNEVSDIEIGKELVELVSARVNGDIRNVIKFVKDFEQIAIYKGLDFLDLDGYESYLKEMQGGGR
ncbi:MAG: ATP-binding protein [Thiohalomonadaceae bacterium]